LHRLLGGGLQIPLGLGPGAQHAGDEEVLLAPERLDAVVGVVGNLAFAQEVPLDAVTHLSLLSGAALTAAAAEYPLATTAIQSFGGPVPVFVTARRAQSRCSSPRAGRG